MTPRGANECRALPADAKALANLMLDWAAIDGAVISPMKLQKLLYFCHADYLVQYSQKLIKQNFEAWDYGPVIPSIYAEFKSFRANPITVRAEIFNPITAERCVAKCDLPSAEKEKIRRLYSFYCRFESEELSSLSHEQKGPWRHARSLFSNGLNMDRRMTDDLIARHHRLPHD